MKDVRIYDCQNNIWVFMVRELPYEKHFLLRLKGAVYKSYVRSVILYRCEAWCLNKGKMRIL